MSSCSFFNEQHMLQKQRLFSHYLMIKVYYNFIVKKVTFVASLSKNTNKCFSWIQYWYTDKHTCSSNWPSKMCTMQFCVLDQKYQHKCKKIFNCMTLPSILPKYTIQHFSKLLSVPTRLLLVFSKVVHAFQLVNWTVLDQTSLLLLSINQFVYLIKRDSVHS